MKQLRLVPGIVAALVCLVLYSTAQTPDAPDEPSQTAHLQAIVPIRAPQIKRTTFYYYADLKFIKAPAFFYAFYDSVYKSLVIDCNDVDVKYQNKTNLNHPVFKSVSTKTLPTKLSLAKQHSLITIGLERGWNYKATLENESVIRITIWKEMSVIQKERNSSLVLWSIIASIAFGALLITLALVTTR